jgi:sarcosine oxidase, subunit alpha
VAARRVPASAEAPAGPRVTFTFDGRLIEGIEGEPLAVSLLAAGRPILSRSFRFHRPRGLMCSTGQCGWCECEVDGVPSVRSCRVPVREGLVARGEHAWPSVERDLLSLVGLFSRWIPPTFYHHRFLRPRRLRKRYLDVLRWFGGRGRLRVGPREPWMAVAARPLRRITADVLVVGGGRAGLLAATAAAEAGAWVVLIEAERAIGTGWRSDDVADLDTAPRAAGVELLTSVTAAGWYDGVVAAIGPDAHLEIAARTVVAATGSYDRVPLVPGADRPGVLAARTVIGLVERYGLLPGERALLVGSGPELETAGEVLARAGIAEAHGPVATDALVRIRGTNGVAGADLRIGRRCQHVAADLVVFGDRSPNLDLVLAAGANVERRGDTLVPTCDRNGRTTVPTLFVAGSAAGRAVVDDASAEAARAAGRAAAGVAAGRRIRTPTSRAAAATTVQASHVPASIARGAMVCFCEDVRAWEIRAELDAGYDDPELVKRRTGALTGPCQGKQCLQSFACLFGTAGDGPVDIPNGRPPLRPIRLGDLVATPADAAEADA